MNHFPFPSLSDPVSHHIQSLLPQEFQNLLSSIPSVSTLVKAPVRSFPSHCSNPLTGLPGFVTILEQSFQHIVTAAVIPLKGDHVISLLHTPSGFPFSENVSIVWSACDEALPDQALFASWALALSTDPLRSQQHGMPFIIHSPQCSLLPLLVSRACSQVWGRCPFSVPTIALTIHYHNYSSHRASLNCKFPFPGCTLIVQQACLACGTWSRHICWMNN